MGPGSPNALYGYAQAMQGKKSGPYRITNEAPAVFGLLPIVGDATIIYRVKGSGGEPNPRDFEGRRWSGAEWVERWRAALLPGVKCVKEDHNEVIDSAWLSWWVNFEIERMAAWSRYGEITTVGNFAVGSFRPEHVPVMRPMIEYAISHGHILALNTYWYDEAPDRFRYFLPLVDAFPSVQWCLNEVGWAANNASYQPGQLWTLLGKIREIKHPGFKGASLWGLNGAGGGWPQSDYGDDWRRVAVLP